MLNSAVVTVGIGYLRRTCNRDQPETRSHIQQRDIAQIAGEFELFEGNVQRGLNRVGNLLDEWTSIATLRKDLTTLEKLGELRFTVPGGDSLYLRL